MGAKHHILVLVGPTASGKTAAALKLAGQHDGVIINADAMQMYADLRIITARPTEDELAQAPHRLYGVLDATTYGNAALWCDMVIPEIETAWHAGKLPMLVGGTGMYLQSLMQGMADIPEIPADIREQIFNDPYPYEALQAIDPVMAARLEPGDLQRVRRALEVVRATHKSLADWQAEGKPRLPHAIYRCFSLMPKRPDLYARINARFQQMMKDGALEEVRSLMEKTDDTTNLPILKSHGVPELIAHLHGHMSLENAIAQAQQHTRNYAKRQMTWIRGQLPQAKLLDL